MSLSKHLRRDLPARLPESKEAAISRYRAALEGHGIDTAAWWDRALGLELLGTMVQFGWEKALGGPGPELDWWTRAGMVVGPRSDGEGRRPGP